MLRPCPTNHLLVQFLKLFRHCIWVGVVDSSAQRPQHPFYGMSKQRLIYALCLSLGPPYSCGRGIHRHLQVPVRQSFHFDPGDATVPDDKALILFWFVHQRVTLEHCRQPQAAGPDPSFGLAQVSVTQPKTTAWTSIMWLGQIAKRRWLKGTQRKGGTPLCSERGRYPALMATCVL